jgi:hypothetical protein
VTPSLLVLNLELVDSSGEVADQREDHERRLAAVREILASELAARDVYAVVDPRPIRRRSTRPGSASICTPAMAARFDSRAMSTRTAC